MRTLGACKSFSIFMENRFEIHHLDERPIRVDFI